MEQIEVPFPLGAEVYTVSLYVSAYDEDRISVGKITLDSIDKVAGAVVTYFSSEKKIYIKFLMLPDNTVVSSDNFAVVCEKHDIQRAIKHQVEHLKDFYRRKIETIENNEDYIYKKDAKLDHFKLVTDFERYDYGAFIIQP